VTKQIKADNNRLEGLRNRLPISSKVNILKFAVLTSVALQVALVANAQGNLVDLYNWSNETRYSGSPGHNVQIDSSDSAVFFGSQSTNDAPSPFALPVLTGNFDTTPGDIYEISFTMQNNFFETIGQPTISVGGFLTNFDLPAAERGSGGQLQFNPVNIDFSYVATSSATEFEFMIPLDTGDGASLNNFSIAEVPESSTDAILGSFVCLWFLMRRWRMQRA
jgi:hypothetical protein